MLRYATVCYYVLLCAIVCFSVLLCATLSNMCIYIKGECPVRVHIYAYTCIHVCVHTCLLVCVSCNTPPTSLTEGS
jgi:hypothetical protein